jgi:hypothetical protein
LPFEKDQKNFKALVNYKAVQLGAEWEVKICRRRIHLEKDQKNFKALVNYKAVQLGAEWWVKICRRRIPFQWFAKDLPSTVFRLCLG